MEEKLMGILLAIIGGLSALASVATFIEVIVVARDDTDNTDVHRCSQTCAQFLIVFLLVLILVQIRPVAL